MSISEKEFWQVQAQIGRLVSHIASETARYNKMVELIGQSEKASLAALRIVEESERNMNEMVREMRQFVMGINDVLRELKGSVAASAQFSHRSSPISRREIVAWITAGSAIIVALVKAFH